MARSAARLIMVSAVTAAVAACQPAPDNRASPPILRKQGDSAPYSGVAVTDTIRLVGTEPFWGGELRDGRFVLTTPENQAGEVIAVRRFAGNNGLGFSGALRGDRVDLAITPGVCSDGMSDRSYPFTATLRLGDEQRSGCAWTERQPYSETTPQ